MTKRFFLIFMTALLCQYTWAAKRIRVACVGNSVTYGYGLPERESQCYPFLLQQMLGEKYEVGNFGHSGATLLQHGHRPYVQQKAYQEALDFKADMVVIHLGLNDTDPRNWPNYNDEFNKDYRALIQSFRQANPKAKIWICKLTPIFDRHARFQSGTRDWHAAIQQRIEQIARTNDVQLIDLWEPLSARPELFPDALHPNAEGARLLAGTVHAALTGEYGGLKMGALYTDGMVMQRREPIIFHGMANAGERVKVHFANSTQTAITAPNGRWQVRFPAMEAGGPFTATVIAKSGKKTLNHIYVGEVWLCSGQSNMEFTVGATSTAKETLKAAGEQPYLRLFNMPAIYPTQAIKWSLAALDSVNNLHYLKQGAWTGANATTVKDFSAIAYHFGKTLADSLHIPVGIICNAVGGTTTESWIDRQTLEEQFPVILHDWYHADFGQAWARERALFNISLSENKLQRHPYEPAYMFEAGMLPLQNFPLKGVVWYQGESNAHNIELHEKLFTLLQSSWRKFFGNPALPFYFAQLSSLNRPSWCDFRNSQRQLAATQPHTFMTVTADLGDSLDVHYPNKQPVGERLGRQALHHTYQYVLPAESPVCVSARHTSSGVVLRFDHAEGLHAPNGRPIGFELAGNDGIYHQAEARIDGTEVIVTSASVPQPASVRYAWQPFTRANLFNKAQLPCSTFALPIDR